MIKWQREVSRGVRLRESRHAYHANVSYPCLAIPRRPVGQYKRTVERYRHDMVVDKATKYDVMKGETTSVRCVGELMINGDFAARVMSEKVRATQMGTCMMLQIKGFSSVILHRQFRPHLSRQEATVSGDARIRWGYHGNSSSNNAAQKSASGSCEHAGVWNAKGRQIVSNASKLQIKFNHWAQLCPRTRERARRSCIARSQELAESPLCCRVGGVTKSYC